MPLLFYLLKNSENEEEKYMFFLENPLNSFKNTKISFTDRIFLDH